MSVEKINVIPSEISWAETMPVSAKKWFIINMVGIAISPCLSTPRNSDSLPFPMACKQYIFWKFAIINGVARQAILKNFVP